MPIGYTPALHRPFAWFGEHSRFDGYQGYGDYHPGHRRLRPGEVAILDVSPVVDGYAADVRAAKPDSDQGPEQERR